MIRFEKMIYTIAGRANWISAAAVLLMMLLTTADVILRFFGYPIPGTYEVVGLLGSVVISFSLAYTSVEKGHIAVEFLVNRLSEKSRYIISAINSVLGIFLFGLISYQSFLYASELRQSGEVSLTLQMKTYPFVYGICAGCLLLCLVLVADFMKSLRGAENI